MVPSVMDVSYENQSGTVSRLTIMKTNRRQNSKEEKEKKLRSEVS